MVIPEVSLPLGSSEWIATDVTSTAELNGRLEILIGGHSLHTAFSSQSCVSTYRSKWNIIDPILTLGTWDTILQLKANYLANEAAQTTAVPETPVEEGANQEGGEL